MERTLKLMLSYRGTRYHGFQRQENAVTVQSVTEAALSKVLNQPITITGCSRTDTGVHARQFCCSLKTDRMIPHLNLMRGVNGELPDDISILSCEDAAADFHARFDCKGKEYIYRIHNNESKNPFLTDLALHYRRPMDIPRMHECAQVFVGTHDFRTFCASGGIKENTVRTIYEMSVKKQGDCVAVLVKGDGFLYNMIRILVGTLLMANEQSLTPSDMREILAAKDRLRAGNTARAHGLYLNRVFYDTAYQTESTEEFPYFY